jgi:hypothetical protein
VGVGEKRKGRLKEEALGLKLPKEQREVEGGGLRVKAP